MKKSSIPNTDGKPTPEFVNAVRDILEILTGRRRNKITVPTLQTLTFSATPTKAELDALNAYVNAWGITIRALLGRLDD